jgi:hypothetical protein
MWSTTFPQVISHEKALVDCDSELPEFVKTMDILGPKLGPMVFPGSLPILVASCFQASSQCGLASAADF